MGFPMAGHLARAGHEVTVHNRTGTKAAAWVKTYGASAVTPAEATKGAEIVLACVGNDDDVCSVVTGPDGALTVGLSFKDIAFLARSPKAADPRVAPYICAVPPVTAEFDIVAVGEGSGLGSGRHHGGRHRAFTPQNLWSSNG